MNTGLITFGGLGSGLDVNSIIDALVQAERAPLQFNLDRQESQIQITLSGLGALKSALSEIRSAAFELSLASNFNQRTVTTGSREYFSTSASTSALIGNYDIEVKNLSSGSELSTNIFTGGATTTFGDGTLTFTLGSDTFDVAVSASDTLQDIRNNINDATDNIGVSVNLLNDVTIGPDTGSLLRISSDKSGTGNDLVVTYSGDASLADLSDNLNIDTTAKDAVIEVDGFSISSSTNLFSNVLEGVDITAKKANILGETTNMAITQNTKAIKNKIEAFVEAFNNYAEVSGTLGQTVEGDQGLLVGDYTLRQVNSALRNSMVKTNSAVSGNFNSLSAIGITTTRTGQLELDSDILDDALASNFEQFDELFTGTSGFGEIFVNIIDQYTGAEGSIIERENGLNQRLKRIDEQRIAQEYRIDQLQTRLIKQFAAMDSLVAQLNNTGSFLVQQLSKTPYASKDSK